MVGEGAFDDAGRFYFAAEDRFLYALDADGIMRWRTDLGRRSAGFVAVGADGSIYAGLEDGRLLALNKDGRLLWSVRLGAGKLVAPVLLASGMVIAADTSGRVTAITHAGVRIWDTRIGEELSCAPVVGFDGRIVFGTVGGNLYFLDAAGRLTGQRYAGGVPSVVSPARAGLLLGTTAGMLIRFDETREPVWRVDLGSAVAELLVGAAGDAYAILDDGALAHASPGGVVTWRAHPIPQSITGAVLIGSGIREGPDTEAAEAVLVGITGGSLALISADGTLSWQMPLAASPLGINLDARGSVVVSTARWVTYSFQWGTALSGAWPLVRGTRSATGLPPGLAVSRPEPAQHQESLDYIYLSEFLRSPFEDDQMKALREIAARLDAGEGRVGASYPYVLSLCEEVAGSRERNSGLEPTSDSARREAIALLGRVGDLSTARFLLRLLRDELRTDFQVEILTALSALGTDAGGNGVQVARQVIDRDISRGPSDHVALAVLEYLGAIYAYEGGFLSTDGVELMTRIMGGPYARSTRDRAVDTLRHLAGP